MCFRRRGWDVSQADRAGARRAHSVCRGLGALAGRRLAYLRLTSAQMIPVLGESFRWGATDAAPQQDSPVLSACGSTVR